ncbi:hypothetical protein ANOM_009750 [Aspergillus nomiae NRRL 13137]|uniref:Uncharacterized protein n=1 Tax=Aspergillus nomiae NRRL (strain ATCC 15546 / NRRL 13137 / CBS 260.88 / M93) TaxID=1509407 RepID=A0A0L1ITT1_ASPN3|nr:uncharacterized protein ANOM_009750 [Aspergillus nomiae NRRL 13137]KNG82593.1 hypothetical protein ANOM_009750 [Aspergillus nomiae NRRL 13137]
MELLTKQRLNSIQQKQFYTPDPWPVNSGYLDFVSDTTDTAYLRFYVGQAEKTVFRIKMHIRNILLGAHNTLHYYVIWKGKGHRVANFLRLWVLNLPEGVDNAIKLVLNNILEMTMCCCFQSLPTNLLERWLENPVKSPYWGKGLNVITPLVQDSPDPDIRAWPEVRHKQIQEERSQSKSQNRRVPPLPGVSEYFRALEEAVQSSVGPHSMFNVESACSEKEYSLPDFEQYAEQLTKITGTCPNLLPPFGDLTARIGIILEHGYFTTTEDTPSVKSKLDLPWGLSHTGFDEKNCLIWPFRFQDNQEVANLNNVKSLTTEEANVLGQLNHQLIINSDLKVIIMSGESIHDLILTSHRADSKLVPTSLHLRGYSIQAYIEATGSNVERLYIKSPGLIGSFWADKWSASIQIEVLKSPASSPAVIASEFKPQDSSNALDEEHQLEASITDQHIEECMEQEEDIEPETLTQVALDNEGAYQVTLHPGDRGNPRKLGTRALDESLKRISRTSMGTQISLLAGRTYAGSRRQTQSVDEYTIYVHHLTLRIQTPLLDQIDTAAGFTVHVEIKPSGASHPNRWAINARTDDKAIQLGFRVRMKLKNGEYFEYYPKSSSDGAPMVANSFVDWMEGYLEEEIIQRPRRYGFVDVVVKAVPDSLRPFVGGAYTDDEGNIVPKKRKRAPTSVEQS